MKPTDVRIEAVCCSYEDHLYRAPIKFGGTAVDRVTLLNVECRVRSRDGYNSIGHGSMPLGNVWSFPSKVLRYDDTIAAMKALAVRIGRLFGDCTVTGHPIDIGHALEPEYFKAAADVTRQLQLAEPIPHLCALVVASPFDAAVHDAFGRLHGRNCYHDLGHYLCADFAGDSLDRHVSRTPQPRMPLYHLVGALDPLEASDVTKPIGDGLPETLPQWIDYNGLTHLKIKLNGDDLGWDVDRVVRVDRITSEVQQRRRVETWAYSLDFNERCANVAYLLEFLRRVKDQSPRGFERLAYIEQPTARDLAQNRDNVMHEAAKLRPVVIDESLLDLDSLLLAREMGYTGVALKACKGQTQSLLMAAAAHRFGMFLCVQDLTCPGASLLHSAGLAAASIAPRPTSRGRAASPAFSASPTARWTRVA